MAFAGLKKQINKANQYVTEKMGGAEGTKLDLDFMDMEKKTDVTVELVEELQVKTKEFLQPNPTARAKMAAVKGISKLSGQAKSNTYPQPEGLLADCMLLYGKKLGENSIFADSLIEMGESLRQMADVKYSLDDNVKQNVLEPLHHLQTKDLKEVMHHRKKLQGRRLDYDCKRRRQAKGTHHQDEEIRGAEDKFAESLHLAQMGMFNLLENDVEQVSQLVTFSEGLLDYHQQCTEILKVLVETLQMKREECANRPRSEFVPKTLADLNIDPVLHGSTEGGMNGGRFIHSSTSSNTHLSRINNANHNTNRNVYSSQQNLSKTNSNYHSNFSRNRIYGSQQSLSNNSTASSNHNNNNNVHALNAQISSHSSNSHNNNGHLNGASTTSPQSPTDVWLNAWNTPNPPQAAPIISTTHHHTTTSVHHRSQHQNQHHLHHTTTSQQQQPLQPQPLLPSASSQFHNFNNNKNAHFNDPWTASPLPSPMRSPARTPMVQARPSGPHCTAIYDFEPENPGELGFKENDIIQLLNKVDENWYEGSVNGRTGYFPQSYVQVVTPLP